MYHYPGPLSGIDRKFNDGKSMIILLVIFGKPYGKKYVFVTSNVPITDDNR